MFLSKTRFLGLMICFIATSPSGSEVVFSWATPNFAPCEGVGIHGSYRVTARANIVSDSGAKTINSLTVFASSAAFSPDTSSLTVGVDVVTPPAPVQSISLVTQPPDSIAESPDSNETPRLFLPPNTIIPVTANTKLVFNVSATIQTPQGSCAVGSTTKQIDPNQSPDAQINRRRAAASKALALNATRVKTKKSVSSEMKPQVPPPSANNTYLDALINIGSGLGDDGLYYFNLATLIRSAATQEVRDALAQKAPDDAWASLRKLPSVTGYRKMSEPDKNTLKDILKRLGDAVLPVAKPIMSAATAIETWLGEQSVGLDAFEALDDDNPERRGSVEDLHKTADVFVKTTPADAFATSVRDRPRFAANLIKYLAK